MKEIDKRDIQYNKYEAVIDGDLHNGIILEVCDDGIMVRPMYVNNEYQYLDGEPVKYEPYWISIDEFDDVKLEIFDDNWGCDDSAIGVEGCFEPWYKVWDADNMQFSYY